MATVTTRQGDTWDILSKRIYGDEHYMNDLIAANIEYRDVALFSAGVTITAPEIDTTEDITKASLPPWKR